MSICVKMERNGLTSADQGFLQPAKAAVICTAPRAETCPPPPIPSFLLAQKPIFKKQIVPTIACGQSCMMSTLVISH